MKAFFGNLKNNNRGSAVIEIILVLVVLIALVVIFRTQITAIVDKAFAAITGNADKIIN